MADTNPTRRVDDTEFSENDPFAELTRIMGHDPRASQPGQAAPDSVAAEPASEGAVADDFDIDLEKELMGDLDFAGFDMPGEGAQAGEPEAFEVSGDAAGAVEVDAYSEQQDWRDETQLQDDAQPALEVRQTWDTQPAWDAPPAWDERAVEEEAALEPVSEPTATDALPHDDDDFDFDLNLDDFSEEEAANEPAPRAASETEFPAMDEPEPEWAAVAAAEPEWDAVPPAEPAWEDLPSEEIEPTASFEGEPVFLEQHDEPEAPEFVADAPPSGELSLEDELSALLAGQTSPAVGHEPEAFHEPVPEAAFEGAPALEEWHPSVDTFGRADQPPVEFVEPASFEHEHAAGYGGTAPSDDFADLFGAMELDLELDEQPGEFPEAPEQLEPEPEPMGFAPIPPAPAREPIPEPSYDPQAYQSAAEAEQGVEEDFGYATPAFGDDETPEVETVEIADAAAPVADDLDIPDIDYGASASSPRLYDDLDGEFEQAFGDLAFDDADHRGEPAAPAYAAPAYDTAAYAGSAAAAASVAAAMHGGHEAATARSSADAWQDEQDFAEDAAYREELDRAIAASSYEDDELEDAPPPRRRGLLIAAFVAAVALVGGVGVFGMSFLGGGSDGPVLVSAGDDPMKVRPENPGGATVPNQDNQVYQRVTGGESDAPPQQESLITTAEEPLDVTAAEPLPLPSGISGEGEEQAAASMQPKSEDRIEPAAEADGIAAIEEAAVVTPRRVRTMVVRPDGTLVPREEVEEPAVASQENVADQALAAAPVEDKVPTLGPAASDNVLPGVAAIDNSAVPAGDDEGGPVVETPATVAVVPTQRTEPAAAPAQVAQEPATAPAAPAAPAAQAPVATPVSAPAAAAPSAGAAVDGWSMQIASQPTAESAQATYQDLARRYGGVLEGRGVNIVRADIEGMGVYYRVRIPATSRDEAIQLCTNYKSAGGSCFVSR